MCDARITPANVKESAMPNFDTAASILTQISSIQWATQGLQGNRAKINRLMNGDAPWTEAERQANRLNTNINWLEGPRVVKNSDHQIANAFFGPGDYFSITLDTYSRVPAWKRDEWSSCLTSYINKALRDSDQMESTLEQAIAQMVLHGPGPSIWRKAHSVIPETCGVEDVLVPAGTLADMSNLNFFALYREWTWGQLRDMALGDAVDRGWNTDYIKAMLAALYKQPLQPLYQGNRWMFPEKIAEDFKENSNTFAAAALGRALVWDTYFKDEDTGKWNRRILLDYNNVNPEGLKQGLQRQPPEFLFERDNFADDWRHIIHWFIGNCSTVAPYRYYSIRSIGYQLYGPAFAQNMARNRAMDHVLMALLTWFRNVSEDDRERLEQVQLQHLGIFPDGLSMVTAGERYEVDWNLVGNFLNSNRQLMAESSAAYLPDVASNREGPARTATEAMIINNSSVTLTSNVQSKLYRQAKNFWNETVRRVCLKDTRDPITAAVMKRMKLAGIPPFVLDPDIMEITPNRVMGGGNRAVELTVAKALFDAKPMLPASATQPIDRKYVLALTSDPDFVRQALPPVPVVSATVLAAQNAFGTLMDGVPYDQSDTINEMEYVQTLLQRIAIAMQPLEALQSQPNGMAIIAVKVVGLMNVIQHTEEHIQVLAKNPAAREAANNFQRAILQMAQQLKAYGQRLAEMEQAQAPANGMDAVTEAKVQAIQATTQVKLQGKQAENQVKLQHKDAAFMSEQQRKDAATAFELRRKAALTHADVAATDLTTTADLVHQSRQAQLDRDVARADAAQEAIHAEVGHRQELLHASDAHAQERVHAADTHEQEQAHAAAQHEADLAAAKAKAAATKSAKKPTAKK